MDSLFFPPLPVPMIKNECEEIVIDTECSDDYSGKSKTDLWDEEVRKKIAKLVVYQNEKIFSAVVDEYLRLLKRHTTFIDKQNLLDKISNHIEMFTTFYQGHENAFQQKYLDLMEEVMTVFSNVQMDIVRQIKKRGCNKAGYVVTIKAIAQKMCRLLSSSLLHNLKHILHVLLKSKKHDVEPPSWKDIMNTVYSHFLIQYPLHDYSSESFCRNFLLFERWKEITRVENHKDMEKTLYYRCRQTPKSVKADKVISSILMPSSMDSVTDIVTHLIKRKSDAIKSYFDYIEKQKKKCTADEPVCLNDLSFCDLDDDLDYLSRGSDECSKLFYDIVKDYENAKTQGIRSTEISNDDVNEDLSDEGDCIVIDDDDVPEYRQKESNLVCVISDSDSDCEMVYLSNPTKKKNNTKTKSVKNTLSIPQLWSKTFPDSIENADSVSEANACSAQSDDQDDDIQILDSECVSSVELSRQQSVKKDTGISFDKRTQIQKGDSDIREVLRNLVIESDPELTKTNDENEVVNSSPIFKETDLNRVSIPDKNIQSDPNLSSNLTDSTTNHDKNNIQDDNCHHCSCCAKNKLTSSPPLLISTNQDSGDNREIERSKIAEVSTEIRIGLESMPNDGHTYSYGLITPPSDQPAEGNSSPTCDNVYVEISATDSPRSVVNSESEEIPLEDEILSNETLTVEDASENENIKSKDCNKSSLTKGDSSKCGLKDGEEVNSNVINKENPIERLVDNVDKEMSELINESVEQKTKNIENIANGENLATIEENHSVNCLDDVRNIAEKNDVHTNMEVENTIPIISEELIVFRSRPSPNNNGNRVETSAMDNNKQSNDVPPNLEETSSIVGENSFATFSDTSAELTNFPQYVIIDGQHYVVNNEIQSNENADLKSDQFQIAAEEDLTDGVYLDENGRECFVENEDHIQAVIINDVYYSCENGLLTIEEVNQLNSSNASPENTSRNLEKETVEVTENQTSNVTSNMNPEMVKECHNDVTSTTPTETVSEDLSINEKRKNAEENIISHPSIKETCQINNSLEKSDSKNTKSPNKIMFTSTESIKLTDFDKFERSVNNKLVDLDEHNDLWESAFSGPVTKLNSNSGSNFSGEAEEIYSFQDTKEKKELSKINKPENVCRSYSVSPTENSPEYETIETNDFKKYIQEKENTIKTNTEKKTSKYRKQNSLLIHLDKSKIPESVLQKAKEQKKNQKAMEEAQNVTKSVLKRKSVSESQNPSKKRATVSPAVTEVLIGHHKFEPEHELKKEKEKGEHSDTKSRKNSRRSSESEKQKAIEVVFGKSKYMKNNIEHLAEESKRKLDVEPEEVEDDKGFIEMRNLSSHRKQQIAYGCVIRYYSKKRKVYDPQLFEMLPEISLPFFNEKELLKKWNSQRMEKINYDRWRTLEKYLKVHHKDRGMKRSCIQERVFYDKTTNSAEVIVYNGGSTHESSSLTSSPGYSGAKNYNSGKPQQHAHLMDKSRGNGAILEKSTPLRKKRGNARKSVSNKKIENTASIAASYQCRNTNSNDVISNTPCGTTSEEKSEIQTFQSVGPNSRNRNSLEHLKCNSKLQFRNIRNNIHIHKSNLDTSDQLKTGISYTQKGKRGYKPSTIDSFSTKNNDIQYEHCKKAKIEKKTPWSGAYSEPVTSANIFDINCGSSTAGDEVRERKKSSRTLQNNIDGSDVEKVISKSAPKGIISRESNTKNNSEVRVTFGAVIVHHYDVDINELNNKPSEKKEILLNSGSLKTMADVNGLSLNRKNQQMSTSNTIKRIFENKIKNKVQRQGLKRHKEVTFDKCIKTHNKLNNGSKKVPLKKKVSEDLEHKFKGNSTTVRLETSTDDSMNQEQVLKAFKTPAQRKELPPLLLGNSKNSTKLPSYIINDQSNIGTSDAILQGKEMSENESTKKIMSPDSFNQKNVSDSVEKKLSPLPVLFNLSSSSKCFQQK